MRVLLAACAALLLATPPAGAFFVAGDFNGWNAAGNEMTDMGGGVWSLELAFNPGERHEFKVTTGDWSNAWPQSGNSWFITDVQGYIKLTFDTNTYGDGWLNSTNRIGVSHEPGTWTAVGDWQGWANADPATAMAAMGGGIYMLESEVAPGSYQYKAVNTGTWDAIGGDARGVNADTIHFDTTPGNTTVRFWVDAGQGVAKVEVVPEPAGVLALASGLAGFACALRRRS